MQNLPLFEIQPHLIEEPVDINFPDLAFQLLFSLSVLEMSCGKYIVNIARENIVFTRRKCKFKFQIGEMLFFYPCNFTIHFREFELFSFELKSSQKGLADPYFEMHKFLSPYATTEFEKEFILYFKLITQTVVNEFMQEKGLYRFLFSKLFRPKIVTVFSNVKDADFPYDSIFNFNNPRKIKHRNVIELIYLANTNQFELYKTPKTPDNLLTTYEAEKWEVLDNIFSQKRIAFTFLNDTIENDDELISVPESFVAEDKKQKRRNLILERKYTIRPSLNMTRDEILRLSREQIDKLEDSDILRGILFTVGLNTKQQLVELIRDFKEFHRDLNKIDIKLVTKDDIVYLYDFEIEMITEELAKKLMFYGFGERNKGLVNLKENIEIGRNQKIKDIKK
jgi:hypothetical protein